MTEKTERPVAELSFEEALAELEEVVTRLESGEVALEQSIALYERGNALREHCEKKLKDAELKVEKITAGPEGEASATEPMEVKSQ